VLIPDDLMDTDLSMADVKRIIEARKVAAAAEAIINPSERVIQGAKARIEWAAAYEAAVKAGEETLPEKP
jgi:hypothetical protein